MPEERRKIEVATLVHSSEGTYLEVSKRPIHAVLLEWFGEDVLMPVTGHIFCCNMPEWAFNIRWGKRDEDGYTSKTLGNKLWRFGQWACLGFGTWKKEERIGKLDVTPEWIMKAYPDADPIFTDTSPDSMRGEPDDKGDVRL